MRVRLCAIFLLVANRDHERCVQPLYVVALTLTLKLECDLHILCKCSSTREMKILCQGIQKSGAEFREKQTWR